jgi:tripartite-type tricarboxylate transporter receptor subunit TctC
MSAPHTASRPTPIAPRRGLLALGAATALAISGLTTWAGPASAQTFPSKPVRLVVHNNPGSALDVVARQLSQRLTERWQQPVVIDNRPAAGGIVGTDAVAKAAPDGYTLLAAGDGPITILPALQTALPYDPQRDLAPVVSLGTLDFVLVAHPRTGFKSLQDFVDAARRSPGKYNIASAGNGSPQHFAAELLKQAAGIFVTHIPYNGGPAGLTGVLSGDVDVMFIAVAPSLGHIRSGRLVALATGGTVPSPQLPDVPTLAQTYPGLVAGTWLGLFAPAGTPAPVLERLAADSAAVLADPAVRSQLAAQGISAGGQTGAPLRAELLAQAQRYQGLVRAVGIRAD